MLCHFLQSLVLPAKDPGHLSEFVYINLPHFPEVPLISTIFLSLPGSFLQPGSSVLSLQVPSSWFPSLNLCAETQFGISFLIGGSDSCFFISRTNTEELNRAVKIGGSLCCSDYALVELTVLRNMGQAMIRVKHLNFRRGNFQLFSGWDPLGNCLQEQRSWRELALLKDVFLKTQELLIAPGKEIRQGRQGINMLSKDPLVKQNSMEEIHRQWSQGQV